MHTFVELLRHWQEVRAQDIAFRFLCEGSRAPEEVTFADLDRKARSVAAHLQGLGVVGERALLLYPPGLAYIEGFMGCLYAGVTAVPAYPPDPARPKRSLPRLEAIAADARPRIVLTTSLVKEMASAAAHEVGRFAELQWVASDTVSADAEDWETYHPAPEQLAFLQYTSGSTGTPKGVMVSHGNLVHNSECIRVTFGHTDRVAIVSWLPLYHDMGLIGKVLHPLYMGRPCTLMAPISFLKNPISWLQAISKYRGTTSGAPNFAYDLCVRKATPELIEELDLRSWEVAFVGAEPVRHQSLERFYDTFRRCGFRREAFLPCYGLAESTLMATGGHYGSNARVAHLDKSALSSGRVDRAQREGPGTMKLVGAGLPAKGHDLLIVDPETHQPCSPGTIGEIWITGPSVAQGYWNRPEESEAVFGARLAGEDARRFLRTGDLGFLDGGELYVTGRIKDLIILFGKNHYPQDFELTVERAHRSIRPGGAVAFSVEAEQQERLVLLAEIDPRQQLDAGESPASVLDAIRFEIIREHEVQPLGIALLAPGSIQRTSSGKVQRGASKAAFLAGCLPVRAQWPYSLDRVGEQPRAL